MSLNHVCLDGRLTKDPEIRYTQSKKAAASFRLAVNRDGEGTDFLNCTAWDKTATFLEQYFKKGSRLILAGKVRSKEWEKDGKKQYGMEIVADRIYFGDSKKDAKPDAFEEIEDDDTELPF